MFDTNIAWLNTTTQLYIKTRLMHTFTINATILTLCHSTMFQPSKGHFQQQGKLNELPDVKLN